MPHTPHPWHSARNGWARRAALGALISLSMVLVAFEWRGAAREPVYEPPPLEPEPPYEFPKVIIIEKEQAKAAAPEPKRKTSSLLAATPDPTPDEGDEAEPDPVDGPDKEGPKEGPPEPTGGRAETDTSTGTLPWDGVSQRPYFMDCLKRSPRSVDACTEDRIEAHLRRHFTMPQGLRGAVRTMVTFEIDAQGRIGRLVCTPRPDPAVQQEVERVLRLLPQFVPGSQSGYPVPVYYRIPLSLKVH